MDLSRNNNLPTHFERRYVALFDLQFVRLRESWFLAAGVRVRHRRVAALIRHLAAAGHFFLAHLHAGQRTGKQRAGQDHQGHGNTDELPKPQHNVQFTSIALHIIRDANHS